jgi:hypothetical protein
VRRLLFGRLWRLWRNSLEHSSFSAPLSRDDSHFRRRESDTCGCPAALDRVKRRSDQIRVRHQAEGTFLSRARIGAQNLLAEAILFASENPCGDWAASSVPAPPLSAVTEPIGDHQVRPAPAPEPSSRRNGSPAIRTFSPDRRLFFSWCAIGDDGPTVGRTPPARSLRTSKDQACAARPW